MLSRKVGLALLCFALLGPSLFARGGGKAPTAPGSYTKWGDDIDQIEIVSSFNSSDYKRIVVMPIDTTSTPLPPENENTFKPVTKVLGMATEPFIDGLKDGLKKRPFVVEEGQSASGDHTLLVRTKVESMNPGSQAARMFAGFGAGAAATKLSGEVLDARTNQVLFRFTQERRSGVGAVTLRSDYVALFNRNLKAIGKDVARILTKF